MPLLSVYRWLYQRTDGRFTWIGGLLVLLLRSVGRRTGQERTSALVYLNDGEDIVVVASNGGRDRPPVCLLNVQEDPDVGVQIDRERTRMRARVTDPKERERLWPLVSQNHATRYDAHQAKTKREIPLVILSPL